MFKDRELKNALFKIAVPVALQNLLTSLLNMIDTMMIGSLGDKAVAAVGLANQWFFIFNLITFGIVSGSTIYISQFYGKKDYHIYHNVTADRVQGTLFKCFALKTHRVDRAWVDHLPQVAAHRLEHHHNSGYL